MVGGGGGNRNGGHLIVLFVFGNCLYFISSKWFQILGFSDSKGRGFVCSGFGSRVKRLVAMVLWLGFCDLWLDGRMAATLRG